jgi:hypothetical protein
LNPAPAICPSKSGVNFRDTNKYVDSILCMTFRTQLLRLPVFSLLSWRIFRNRMDRATIRKKSLTWLLSRKSA